ncbi:Uncharacterised protein [Mycobacteroides abscessus subsp. abscessus]|nr:Uncharacterised protein [Mycobacteroides abscessus subsp. abscessus]
MAIGLEVSGRQMVSISMWNMASTRSRLRISSSCPHVPHMTTRLRMTC